MKLKISFAEKNPNGIEILTTVKILISKDAVKILLKCSEGPNISGNHFCFNDKGSRRAHFTKHHYSLIKKDLMYNRFVGEGEGTQVYYYLTSLGKKVAKELKKRKLSI